jgi:hypothetical protein
LVLFFSSLADVQQKILTIIQFKKKQKKQNKLVDHQRAKNSLIPFLIDQPEELKIWEKSPGLSAFFGGDLSGALTAFDDSFDQLSFQEKLGWVRSHLEWARAYETLDHLSNLLFKTWIKSERDRPNSQLHHPWYDWLEWIKSSSTSPPETLSKNKVLNDWIQLKNLDQADLPQGLDPNYRRWVSFFKAVQTQNLKKASRLLKKIDLNAPMYSAQGQGDLPALSVYDPRVIQSLIQYHASQALSLSREFKGPARSLYAQSLMLLNQNQEALKEINRLLQEGPIDASKSKSFLSLLIASENGSWSDWLNQQKAFKVRLLVSLNQIPKALTFFKQWSAYLSQVHLPSPPSAPPLKQLKTVNSQTLMSTLWLNVGASWLKLPTSDPLLKSFPHLNILIEQRKDFAEQFLEMLEKQTKAQHRSYVISTQILTRWIDRMQLRYGESLLRTDQRVFAISALQGAEDSTAPMRRKNRNRIDLLITTTQANYIMNRHRTALKYLTRMRDNLPSCLFVLEMMSDLLSKKGSSIESNVNGGQ